MGTKTCEVHGESVVTALAHDVKGNEVAALACGCYWWVD